MTGCGRYTYLICDKNNLIYANSKKKELKKKWFKAIVSYTYHAYFPQHYNIFRLLKFQQLQKRCWHWTAFLKQGFLWNSPPPRTKAFWPPNFPFTLTCVTLDFLFFISINKESSDFWPLFRNPGFTGCYMPDGNTQNLHHRDLYPRPQQQSSKESFPHCCRHWCLPLVTSPVKTPVVTDPALQFMKICLSWHS